MVTLGHQVEIHGSQLRLETVFGMVSAVGMWTIHCMDEPSERSETPPENLLDQAGSAKASVRGLPARVVKAKQMDVERVADGVVLMHLTSLEFRLLNDVGALLWDVVDDIPEPSEWVEMMVEARPEIPRGSHELHVIRFVEELVGAGFLVVENAGPGSVG